MSARAREASPRMASEVSEIPRSQREERLSTRLSTTLGKDGELPEVTVSGAALPQVEKPEAEGGKGSPREKGEAGKAQADKGNSASSPRRRLKEFAHTFKSLPSILKKRKKPSYETSEIRVKTPPKWENLKKSKRDLRATFCLGDSKAIHERGPRQYVQKVVSARSPTPGGVSKYMNKYYTSKYRGVHQTFPTRRWEAQFRKSGKPTSLGCFNTEEEAARAYDTMMIWCMIHQPENARPDKTITNFSLSDYDFKIPELTQMTQEDLVLALRRLGRKQASEHSNSHGGRGSALLHPLQDNTEEARIREDLGLGNKDPTCKQMYDRISDQAPDFLPDKAKGGKYVLGTLKMQRTTLVKAYLKWLDSRAAEKK